MENLPLNKELYVDICNYMMPKYSINTQKYYSLVMKKMFKTHEVLNHQTLKKIMKDIKHQNQRAVLVLINNYCFDNEIPFNINIPRVKKQKDKLPDILSPEEIRTIIKSAPKPYDLVIRCIFNMGAGLRISEIIKMRWGDVRWIDWLRDKENYGVVLIKSGKGSKDRVVNIPKNLMRDLYEYAKSKNLLNEFGIPSGGQMFKFGDLDRRTKTIRKLKQLIGSPTEEWKHDYVRFCYDWFRYNILIKHCEKALNKPIKIHSLRHSRATYLYEIEKVPVEKIQILLGHSSLNTTMLYTRINPRSVFEMIKDTKEI